MPTAADFAAKLIVGDADLDRLHAGVNDPPGQWFTEDGTPVDNFRKRLQDFSKRPPVPYTNGLLIDENNYVVESDGLLYIPNPSAIPFTTGATLDPAQWFTLGLTATTEEITFNVTSAQAQDTFAFVNNIEAKKLVEVYVTNGNLTRRLAQSDFSVSGTQVTLNESVDAPTSVTIRQTLPTQVLSATDGALIRLSSGRSVEEEFSRRGLFFLSRAVTETAMVDPAVNEIAILHQGQFRRYRRSLVADAISTNLGASHWSPLDDVVTPFDYGAVGDGLSDDADALEAALNSGRTVRFDALFRSSRTLNVETMITVCDNPADQGIIWDAGVSVGVQMTPTRFDQRSSIYGGFFTKGQGVDKFLVVDWSAFTPNSRVGANGMPRQFNRLTVHDSVIAGENSDYDTAGWMVGFELDKPWGVTFLRNQIFGYFPGNPLVQSDFVTNSYGIHIVDDEESSDVRVEDDNRIFGFEQACDINNVEAIRFSNNDVQVCFHGPRFRNTVRSLNQVYMAQNHIGTSGPSLTLTWGRQAQIMNNQFSYRWGRTDTDVVPHITLNSFFQSVIMGNTFRGGSPGTISVRAIKTEETVVSANVRDLTVIGNNYQDLDSIWWMTGTVAPIEITHVEGSRQSVTSFATTALDMSGTFQNIRYGNDFEIASSVVSYGSGGNGSWYMYADGRMMCQHELSVAGPNSAIGSGFRNASDITWDFPQPFIDDSIALSGSVDGSSNWVSFGGTSEATTVFRRYSLVSDSNTRAVNLIAWGKWK